MKSVKEVYWQLIKEKALELGSDGCTVVPEWRQNCCFEHDVHYTTHHRWKMLLVSWDGKNATWKLLCADPITRREADARFRQCITSQGGLFNDARGWVRWLGVRSFGWWGWRKGKGC